MVLNPRDEPFSPAGGAATPHALRVPGGRSVTPTPIAVPVT